MKKLQKRRLWAIRYPSGKLSSEVHYHKRTLEMQCGEGETVVRVEMRQIHK